MKSCDASGPRRLLSARYLWLALVVLLLGLPLAYQHYLWLVPPAVKLEDLRQEGVIRIGFAIESPYAFVREDLSVSGVEVHTAELVARELGIPTVEWVLVTFSNLIPALESGRFDVIAAGMYVTPERSARIQFSTPHLRVAPGFVHRAVHGEFNGFQRYAIMAVQGYVETEQLQANATLAPRVRLTPDVAAGALAVLNEERLIFALSYPAARALSERFSGLKASRWEALYPETLTQNLTAFGFRKTDAALASQWDAAYSRVRGSEHHREALASFGFTQQDIWVAEPLVRP